MSLSIVSFFMDFRVEWFSMWDKDSINLFFDWFFEDLVEWGRDGGRLVHNFSLFLSEYWVFGRFFCMILLVLLLLLLLLMLFERNRLRVELTLFGFAFMRDLSWAAGLFFLLCILIFYRRFWLDLNFGANLFIISVWWLFWDMHVFKLESEYLSNFFYVILIEDDFA